MQIIGISVYLQHSKMGYNITKSFELKKIYLTKNRLFYKYNTKDQNNTNLYLLL
jgi:hypothetical protein